MISTISEIWRLIFRTVFCKNLFILDIGISRHSVVSADLKMAASNAKANGKQSYTAATGDKEKNSYTGKPVFFKHRDVPHVMEKDLESQEVYKALLKSVPSSKIMGIQKIGGLWRLYISQQDSRIELITSGLNIRDACIAVFDTNPFLPGGNENLLRLTVKDIPLSVDNSVIVDELEKRKYKVSGKVMFPKLRVDGQLTNCLTGDRVIYIDRPPQPVPRIMSFGIFRGKVFHANQIPKDHTSVVCSICLTRGHHRSACTSQVVCRFCKREGHLQRDCPTPIRNEADREGLFGKYTAAAATGQQVERDDNAQAELRPGVSKTTRLTADDRERETSESQSRTPTDRDTRVIPNKESAPGNTQCKITQFIQQERAAHAQMNEHARVSKVPSGDESSDDDSEEYETDNCAESEISIESPEMRITKSQPESEKPKKRKQKKEKKSKKK